MRVNTVILKASLWTSVFLLLAAGCKGTGSTAPASEGGNPESAIVIPDAPKGSEIKGARADFYKQAFPQATLFESKDIPAAMIRDLDKGNTNYIVAKDAQGETLGYLRDVSGPITLNDDCPCNPLSVTLAELKSLKEELPPPGDPKEAEDEEDRRRMKMMTTIHSRIGESIAALQADEEEGTVVFSVEEIDAVLDSLPPPPKLAIVRDKLGELRRKAL